MLILDDLGSGLCYHDWALRLGAAAGDGRWLELRFRIYKRQNYIAQHDHISPLFKTQVLKSQGRHNFDPVDASVGVFHSAL